MIFGSFYEYRFVKKWWIHVSAYIFECNAFTDFKGIFIWLEHHCEYYEYLYVMMGNVFSSETSKMPQNGAILAFISFFAF